MEFFAANQDLDNLKLLTNYSIQRHYPEIQNDSEIPLQFFRKVARAQVELVTGWMTLGFISRLLPGLEQKDTQSGSGSRGDQKTHEQPEPGIHPQKPQDRRGD
ncbi:MAG: protein adenylyltransferase SelO family protein [Desulfohalobiaceae bacterium]|nr:protein adenylyltransferase SelO family protein [Desulfohalobiaceae bacterium]